MSDADAERKDEKAPSYSRQVLASLAVAILIILGTVALVSARIPLDQLPPEQEREQIRELEDRIDDTNDRRDDGREDGSGRGRSGRS
jgi:hypothetical protein